MLSSFLGNLVACESVSCETSIEKFEQSVRIYVNKPQVLNKWTAGSVLVGEKQGKTIECREFLAKSDKIFQNVTYKIEHPCANLFIFTPINAQTPTAKYCSYNRSHALAFDPQENQIQLFLEHKSSDKWLKHTLLKRIAHWCQTIDSLNDNTSQLSTLKLYSNMLSDYMALYKTLKTKYWSKLSSNWQKITNTNPEKFIHEDVSIATYLILAWKHLKCNQVKQFVDVGCGNGLLVYILRNEGYNGYGVDLRRRKIWDIYNICDYLKEQAVDPRVDMFNSCDWIIGNHSDELSPWLPLIANRSTTQACNIFLIPCCLFDFNKKFSVKIKGEARYETYVKYLENIFDKCGYDVIRDKLRIPSTKNVCLIGLKNSQKLVSLDEATLQGEFKLRDVNEENLKSSRNCTKNVSSDIKVLIITRVLRELLNESNEKWLDNWNAGGELSLSVVASLFDNHVLLKLKQECGGLKTLLKNHHQMFDCKNNTVKLKIPRKQQQHQLITQTHKTKDCLFHLYHPNGCLLNNEDCNFKH